MQSVNNQPKNNIQNNSVNSASPVNSVQDGIEPMSVDHSSLARRVVAVAKVSTSSLTATSAATLLLPLSESGVSLNGHLEEGTPITTTSNSAHAAHFRPQRRGGITHSSAIGTLEQQLSKRSADELAEGMESLGSNKRQKKE